MLETQVSIMAIRILKLDCRIVDHALRPARIIVSHAGRHDSSRFLQITLHGPQGVRGYGEGAITALWSGETADSARMLIEQLLAPAILNKSFEHPREALALIDACLYANSFAKSALDT